MAINHFWTLERMRRVFDMQRKGMSNTVIGLEFGVSSKAIALAISSHDPYEQKPSYVCHVCNQRFKLTGFPTAAEVASFTTKARKFSLGKRVSCGGECEASLKRSVAANARDKVPTSETSIEVAIRQVLDDIGVDYIAQKQISYFIADFYIPNGKIIIECQGTFHHADPRVYSDPSKLHSIQIKGRGRDASKREFYARAGYHVVELWQNEIDTDLPYCVKRITEAIAQYAVAS